MTVIGVDNRRVIRTSDPLFDQFPLPAVTAIDARYTFKDQENDFYENPREYIGSGIIISPRYVLTAAHLGIDIETGEIPIGLRVTTSAVQETLSSRNLATSGDLGFNVINRISLTNFNTTNETKDDIFLLETSNTLLLEQSVVGLLAFVNPQDAKFFTIQSAGYPADNVPETVSVNNSNLLNNVGILDHTGDPGDFSRLGRDLVLSPGFSLASITRIQDERQIFYSSNLDTFNGQSGSGIWHSLDGEEPRVLGIHSGGANPNLPPALRRNTGVLLTEELYQSIMAQIESDSGVVNPDLLPKNVIIGSNPSLIPINTPFSSNGNDDIFGTYRKERIIGNGGKDRLFGGGANDRLEGGNEEDQALFTDVFTNYDVITPSNTNPVFEFIHLGGNGEDGIDTTKDIEFGVFEFDYENKDNIDNQELFYVPLQVDPTNATKLKDGPKIRPQKDVLDADGEKIGTMTVESPAWMFDGDVKYNLSIGLDTTKLYNLALIIDRSGSMKGTRILDTKSALFDLITAFEDSSLVTFLENGDVESNIDFGIIGFSSAAGLFTTKNSTAAKDYIASLVAEGGTLYTPALGQGINFFLDPSRFVNATDIAYFLSDGIPKDLAAFPPIAQALKIAADDVRAFGFGGAGISTLNLIDSKGDAQLLSSAGDLFDAFDTSIDKSIIERIDVKKAGSVIETIDPVNLTESGFNLTATGTIDGLEVSREAENEITFELVFNDGTPTVTLDYKITTGQKQVRQQTDNGRTEVLTFSVNQNDFFDPQDSIPLSLDSIRLDNVANSSINEREIIGNDLDNTIQIQRGNNTIFGNGGNDRFVILDGVNFIEGGEGVDTVVIDLTKAEAGGVAKKGSFVNIGKNNALRDVEYIEFRDVRIAVDTLAITPEVSFADKAIVVSEGDAGSTFVTFNLYFSSATTEDVVIDIVSRSNFAEAGIDFVSPIEQLTIPAGESFSEITLEVLGDLDLEGDEEIYLDLTIAAGATFANGILSETIGVNIVDNEINLVTNEDTPLVISASKLLSDYAEQLYGDFTVDDFSLVGVSNSVNGTATINTEGNVEFTPAANFNGIATFDYTVTDGVENVTEIAEITVISVNALLTANNDSVTANEDISLTVLASELFSNDVNPDLERQLSISEVDNFVNGTATIDIYGNVEFTPDANFNGLASFNYTVTDGIDSKTASVSVVVDAVNDAPILGQDSVATNEDTPVTISIAELLSNDTDVETPENLKIAEVKNAVNGTVIINEIGNVEFTPTDNFNGIASFNYTVTDGTDSSTASVSVIVNAINDPLIANDDTATTDEDTPIVISASELFDNDVNNDIEKSLSISSVDNLVNGTATINSQGELEFTPDPNFDGIASFDYIVTEGTDIETASVSVTVNAVNDVPVANADTFTTDEDTSITILATELLSNDTDVETQESLNITEVKNAVNGTVSLNEFGNIEFVPDANFNGTASFEYTLTDNTDNTTGSVTLNVNPVNDTPFITTPFPDLNLPKNPPNSIINFADFFEDIEERDNLFYEVNSSNISIFSGTGNLFDFFDFDSKTRALILDYADDVVGSATITARVTDSEGEFAEDTFTVTIFETINKDTVTTNEETPVTIVPADLLSNDIGDNLSFVGVENAVNGTVVLNEDGNIEFTPDPNFDGTATFNYVVFDGVVNKTGLVSVVVKGINDIPFVTTPIPDLTLAKNPPNSIINFADYFEDVEDGDNLSYSVRTSTSIQGGTSSQFFDSLSFDSETRALILNYADDVVGTASITAKVTDSEGEIAEDTFVVSIVDSNDIVANNDSITIDENTSITVLATELLSNDVGDNLSLIGVSNPVNGTVVLNEFGNVEFTPDADFDGIASFNYTVTDGTENATASVEVVVNSIDDVFIANNDSITIDEDTSVTILATELLGNDTGNNLSLIEVENPVNGTVVLNEGGNVEFTPDANFSGTASFDYILTNGAENATASVEVVVNPINDAPVLVNSIPNITVDKNAPNSIIELTNYFDDVENGNNLAYSLSSSSSFTGGTSGKFFDLFAIDPITKALTLDYAEDVVGTSTITVKATDSEDEFVETSFTVSVVDSSEPPVDSSTVGEYGVIDNLTHELQTISLNNSFTNPVVFVQPLSNNESDSATARLQDISSDGFNLFIQEPSNLDGIHSTEQVSYLVLEAGTWQLPNGDILEVGTVESDRLISAAWQNISFTETFDSTPAVFSQVQTNNDSDFVQTRQRNITPDGFEFGMEEEEAQKKSTHSMEQLGWFALSSGNGNWSGNSYQAGNTADTVTHNWRNISFDSSFTIAPQLFASLASYDGPDSAGIRYQNKEPNRVEIKIAEDTTKDSEINHTTEQVSFLALEGAGLLEAEAIDVAPVLGGADFTITEGETREDYLAQSKTETLFAESTSAMVEIVDDSNFESNKTFDLSFPTTSGATLVEERSEYSVLSDLENNDGFFTSSIRDYAFSPVKADF